jgi:hypothetical protein
MTDRRFSRNTLVAACRAVAIASETEMDSLVLMLDADGAVHLGRPSEGTALRLAKYVLDNPELADEYGRPLADVIVEEAIKWRFLDGGTLLRCLERDGFDVTEDGQLHSQLPDVANLSGADDELHVLLRELGMTTASGHLENAISSHAAGNWSAANGELRNVLEHVINEAAERLAPDYARQTGRGHERRRLLATMVDPPFLRTDRCEWTEDGKSFIEGLFKRLHTEGGHPGLSDKSECTLRLQLVLVVTHNLLRRLKRRLGGDLTPEA